MNFAVDENNKLSYKALPLFKEIFAKRWRGAVKGAPDYCLQVTNKFRLRRICTWMK